MFIAQIDSINWIFLMTEQMFHIISQTGFGCSKPVYYNPNLPSKSLVKVCPLVKWFYAKQTTDQNA